MDGTTYYVKIWQYFGQERIQRIVNETKGVDLIKIIEVNNINEQREEYDISGEWHEQEYCMDGLPTIRGVIIKTNTRKGYENMKILAKLADAIQNEGNELFLAKKRNTFWISIEYSS